MLPINLAESLFSTTDKTIWVKIFLHNSIRGIDMLELLSENYKLSLQAFHYCWKSLLNILLILKQLHPIYAL